jgi:hypothetical protein
MMNITCQPEKAFQKPKFKRFLGFLMSLLVFLGAFGLFKPENVLADTSIQISPVAPDLGNPTSTDGSLSYSNGAITGSGNLYWDIKSGDYNHGIGFIKCNLGSSCFLSDKDNFGIGSFLAWNGNAYVPVIYVQSPSFNHYWVSAATSWDNQNYYIDLFLEWNYSRIQNGVSTGWITFKAFQVPKSGGNPELIYEQTFDNLTFFNEAQNIDNRPSLLNIGLSQGSIIAGLITLTHYDFPALSIELPQSNENYQASNPSEFVAAKIQHANSLQNPYGTVLLKVLDVFNQETYYWRDFWTYYDSGGGDTLFWIPAHSLLSPGNYEIQAYFIDDNIGYPENNQSNYPYLTDADFMAYAAQNGLVSEPVDFTFTGFYTTATPTPTPPVYPSMSPYPSTPPELSPPPYAGSEEICQTPPGSFLDYPVQNLTYAICQAFTFLFLPSENQRDNLSTFLNTWSDNLKKKPPFGYFYLIKSAFSGIDTTATSTEYNFEIPVIGDTLKQAIVFLFWLIAVAYVLFRIKSIL